MSNSFLELAEGQDRRFATKAEDTIVAFSAIWLMIGLAVDGYAHSNIIETETEDFLTPWHAIFYAGFAAAASWIAIVAYRRRQPGGNFLSWVPQGYRWAVYGLLIFAVGGIGDAIWHTIFGIEEGIDALLSPTHLLLLVGMLLISSTPIRSGWAQLDPTAPKEKVAKSILFALGVMTSLIAFFISYLWIPIHPKLTTVKLTTTSEATVQEQVEKGFVAGEIETGLAVAGSMVVTAILLAGMLVLRRSWRLPFGAASIIWGVSSLVAAGVFLEVGGAGDYFIPVAVTALGGLVFDVIAFMPVKENTKRVALVTAPPFVMWTVWSLAAMAAQDFQWVPELWTGLIVANIFVGLGIKVMMFPSLTEFTDRVVDLRSSEVTRPVETASVQT